jgi:hypothetical protein
VFTVAEQRPTACRHAQTQPAFADVAKKMLHAAISCMSRAAPFEAYPCD